MAVLAAVAAGAAVRLYRIGGPSLWLDETLTAWLSRASTLAEMWGRHRAAVPGSALYYILPWAAARMGGPTEIALRSPSIFLGLAAVLGGLTLAPSRSSA